MNDLRHNFKITDAVRYYPDTDTFHVQLTDEAMVFGDEKPADVFTYYDENEVLCARAVEFATRHPRHVMAALRALREHLGYTRDPIAPAE